MSTHTSPLDADLPDMPAPTGPIAIIGAGSIGTAFAVVFALAGRSVRLFDETAAALATAPERVKQIIADLRSTGLTDVNPAEASSRIRCVESLAETLEGAHYVQECAPENLPLKVELFARLDRLAGAEAVLASSSSALMTSQFAASLPGAHRCLVVHPGNPPYLLRVVEVVPASFTDPRVVAASLALMREAGLQPIRVRRELTGFVLNRLQGAVLREAYCLVRDGVVSVEEIDQLMRDGLGLRWAVLGPFETVDLNTRGGIMAHAEKLGPAYARMGAERGQNDPWTPDLVSEVDRQRRQILPLSDWGKRVQWRDQMLMTLLRAKRNAQS